MNETEPTFEEFDDNNLEHVEGSLIEPYYSCEEDLLCNCDNCKFQRNVMEIWENRKYSQEHL